VTFLLISALQKERLFLPCETVIKFLIFKDFRGVPY